MAVVIALCHASVALSFTDAVRAKCAAGSSEGLNLTDPKTRQGPTVNLYEAPGHGAALPDNGQTISAVATRGTHFAVRQMAAN